VSSTATGKSFSDLYIISERRYVAVTSVGNLEGIGCIL